MDRREFIAVLGAAAVAPANPAPEEPAIPIDQLRPYRLEWHHQHRPPGDAMIMVECEGGVFVPLQTWLDTIRVRWKEQVEWTVLIAD